MLSVLVSLSFILLCYVLSLMFFNVMLFCVFLCCLLIHVIVIVGIFYHWLTSFYVIMYKHLFFWRMTLIKLQRRRDVRLFCCVNFECWAFILCLFVLIFDLCVLVFAELYKEYRSLKEAKERKSSEVEDPTNPPESHSSTTVRIYFIWTFIISRLYSVWR